MKIKVNTKVIVKLTWILIYFTIMQDLVCAILLNIGIPAILLKMLYYLKDIIIIALGGVCIVTKMHGWVIRIPKTAIYVLGFCCCLFIYIMIGMYNNGIIASIMGARQYIIPIIMLIVGISVGEESDDNDFAYIEKQVNKLSIMLIFTTIIERLFVPVSVWQNLNMVNFASVVKGNTGEYSTTLIQNFYTGGSRRAVGIAAEPLLLAYFMIPLFSYYIAKCFFEKKNLKSNVFFTTGIFICQVLTLTRAVIVCEILGVIIIVCISFLKNKKLNFNFIVLLTIASFVVFIIFRDKIYHIIYITINNMDGGSAGMHMHQLKKGISYMKQYFYGLGTGSGSNLVAMNGWDNLTTEFAYSNLVLDIGILGLFFYIALLLNYMIVFLGRVNNLKSNFLRGILFGNAFCIVIWLATGVFSPQMWGMKSVLLTWFLIGIADGYFRNFKNRKHIDI